MQGKLVIVYVCEFHKQQGLFSHFQIKVCGYMNVVK